MTRLGNFEIPQDEADHHTFSANNKLKTERAVAGGSKFTQVFDSTFDPCLSWEDIDWLMRWIIKFIILPFSTYQVFLL